MKTHLVCMNQWEKGHLWPIASKNWSKNPQKDESGDNMILWTNNNQEQRYQVQTRNLTVFLLPLTFGHLNPVQPGCSMGKPRASKNWRHNLVSGWPLSSNFKWTVVPCCSPNAVNLHLCMVYIGLECYSSLPNSPPTPAIGASWSLPWMAFRFTWGTRIYGALTLW